MKHFGLLVRMLSVVMCVGLIVCCGCSRKSGDIVSLTGEWEYRVGFDSSYFSNYTPSEWKKTKVPVSIEDLPDMKNYTGKITFRKVLPAEAVDMLRSRQSVAFYSGYVSDVVSFYLNDTFVGMRGSERPYRTGYERILVTNLPGGAFKEQGDNALYAVVVTNRTFPYQGLKGEQIYLGRSDVVYREYYTSVATSLALILLYAAIGMFYIFLGARRLQDRHNLFFGLTCFVFAAFSVANMDCKELVFGDNALLSFMTDQVSLKLLVGFSFLFFSYFLHKKITKRSVSAFVLCSLFAVVDIVAPLHVMSRMLQVFSVLLIFVFIFILADTIHQLAKKNWDAGYIIVGVLVMLAGVVHDILVYNGFLNPPFLVFYALLILIVGFAVLLVNQFIRSLFQFEELNKHLEHKVEERTTELRAAMEELEATNESLIMTNRELEDAKRIADRDMRMAVNLQSSILPGPVQTSEWDVSCVYKPMSGVSGDLYDFFDRDGRLLGAGIFDVSGHGIASGLITMIAKSIVYRNFTQHYDKKLSFIMSQINDALIEQVGNVDNYLTGILIKFKDNIVEYVNAGHTDLALRKANTKKVHLVNLKDEDVKGPFLGLEELKTTYRTLAFRVDKGDELLLFTDCFNESKNAQGEEYGIERITAAFMRAPSSSAADTVSFMMDDFYSFVAADQFKDDLTVVLIKRLV